ncbi:glycosyltransferase family 2 protein [Amycolatopsis anabasis]|uniref:glycosyltransferase family 2 protein n=1 Tax=Amycolatopsis anabasis TaxID=1840409 RepID=UPI001C551C70|nr:glycosyltransferase family 2 protein [Amycolatopsis anabasis]
MVILSFSLTYFTVMVFKGVTFVRRSRLRLGDQEAAASSGPIPRHYSVYFLVAALNEAAVIRGTVHRLAAIRGDCRVVVVDDGSDDGTGHHAAMVGGDRVHVLRRTPPNARQGKGEALNYGLQYVLFDVQRRRLDRRRVLLCVMDADGHLSEGALEHVLPLFDAPDVGGVQLSVRIRNTDRLITRFQDVEFWIISAMTQFGRVAPGTVSLGGNGQFTRLSALGEVGGRPWSKSLTEDLDLSISLNVRGWRTVTTPRAYVDQQGVTKYRALLKQRARWYQGTMMSITRLPEIWRARFLSNKGVFELCAYVLVPWVIVLPWSVIQHYALLQALLGNVSMFPAISGGSVPVRVAYALFWYLTAFFPNIIIGTLYSRRTRQVGLLRALALGHLMLLWNYVGYAATYQALWRILRGKRGWAKTARVVEQAEEAMVLTGPIPRRPMPPAMPRVRHVPPVRSFGRHALREERPGVLRPVVVTGGRPSGRHALREDRPRPTPVPRRSYAAHALREEER